MSKTRSLMARYSMKVIFLNSFPSSIYPDFGYEAVIQQRDAEFVKNLVRIHDFVSYIGHEALALKLSEVLGFPVDVCRDKYTTDVNDYIIICNVQIPAEVQRGVKLTEEELNSLPLRFFSYTLHPIS